MSATQFFPEKVRSRLSTKMGRAASAAPALHIWFRRARATVAGGGPLFPIATDLFWATTGDSRRRWTFVADRSVEDEQWRLWEEVAWLKPEQVARLYSRSKWRSNRLREVAATSVATELPKKRQRPRRVCRGCRFAGRMCLRLPQMRLERMVSRVTRPQRATTDI
ncbi:hypothetical protein GW17_00055542 [Ensete ventricosum]|nr:hypothetical protein GW17_00055542 [Ensete ventricosum]